MPTASKRATKKTRKVDRAPVPKEQEPASVAGDSLGTRIRRMRRERGWKLVDLSERTGLAVSTLSKVENDILSLTFDRLEQTAKGFELSLSEFLADEPKTASSSPATARIAWAKKDSGSELDTDAYSYYYLFENLRRKAMVPIRSQCRARTLKEFGPLLRHPGEEFIFVIQGRVEVCTEYYASEILEKGDGVYLDSQMGHAYLNAGKGEAWIISVNSQSAGAE